MKSFIERHPFWFALGLTVLITVLGLVVIIVGSRVLGLSQEVVNIAVLVLSAAVPLGLIWRLGWWEDAGFVSTTYNTSAMAIPVIGMLFSLMWYGVVTNEARIVPYYLLVVFLVGLGEDALSRGLFVRAFLPQGKWQAVLIPSFLFAISHITQFLGNDMPLQDNLAQMANALIFGILYGAVRLRINNIWPLVITHALNDFFYGIAGFGGPNAIRTLGEIPLSFYLILWPLSLAASVYFMNKSLAATIDGKPVGFMNEPLATSRIENQHAD